MASEVIPLTLDMSTVVDISLEWVITILHPKYLKDWP